MGTYIIGYTASLSAHTSVLAVTQTNAFTQPIIDPCTAAAGLSIFDMALDIDPSIYYFSGDAQTYLTVAETNYPTICPIQSYLCEVQDSVGVLIHSDCSLDDGLGTKLEFDQSDGTITFESSDQNNSLLPIGDYKIKVTAFAGTSEDVENSDTQILQL